MIDLRNPGAGTKKHQYLAGITFEPREIAHILGYESKRFDNMQDFLRDFGRAANWIYSNGSGHTKTYVGFHWVDENGDELYGGTRCDMYSGEYHHKDLVARESFALDTYEYIMLRYRRNSEDFPGDKDFHQKLVDGGYVLAFAPDEEPAETLFPDTVNGRPVVAYFPKNALRPEHMRVIEDEDGLRYQVQTLSEKQKRWIVQAEWIYEFRAVMDATQWYYEAGRTNLNNISFAV